MKDHALAFSARPRTLFRRTALPTRAVRKPLSLILAVLMTAPAAARAGARTGDAGQPRGHRNRQQSVHRHLVLPWLRTESFRFS